MADPGLEAAISGDAPFVGNFTGTSNSPAGPGTQVQLGNNAPVTPTDLTGISEAGAGPFNATIPGPGGDPLAITENFPGGAMGTGGITGQGGTSSAPAGTALSDLGISVVDPATGGNQPFQPTALSFDGSSFSSANTNLLGQNSGLGLPASITPGGVANTGAGGTSPGSSNAPEGTGGVPSNTTLSPFGGGDVGSFVQWYNNLDPSLATSLFTALQKAQAPQGVPQLTGPQPFTVGT